MKEMWEQRYAAEDYAYGTAPNLFLKGVLDQKNLKGNILFPAEGEGRNAVYAAKKGLAVFAFDLSHEGKRKALKLAENEGVEINYEVGDFDELELNNHEYDAAALIYAHFPPVLLSRYHKKVAGLLKPGGLLILEGFSKGNLPYRAADPRVGGPDKEEFLFSTDSILTDFPNFEIIQLEEVEIELNEGLYHIGKGKVIRFIGRKVSEEARH